MTMVTNLRIQFSEDSAECTTKTGSAFHSVISWEEAWLGEFQPCKRYLKSFYQVCLIYKIWSCLKMRYLNFTKSKIWSFNSDCMYIVCGPVYAFTVYKWCTTWEKGSYVICKQQRSRSAHASMQSDLSIICLSIYSTVSILFAQVDQDLHCLPIA